MGLLDGHVPLQQTLSPEHLDPDATQFGGVDVGGVGGGVGVGAELQAQLEFPQPNRSPLQQY